MPEHERAAQYEGPPWQGGLDFSEIRICPSWFVAQPALIEANQAVMALKLGELSTYFPDAENPIVEAAAIGLAAWNQFEHEQMRRLKERNQ